MTAIIETVNKIPDDTLLYIIRNSNKFTWNFLAMKIILTRLNMKITMYENSQSILPVCCDELRNLLIKSANVPSAQTDLKHILSLVIV